MSEFNTILRNFKYESLEDIKHQNSLITCVGMVDPNFN